MQYSTIQQHQPLRVPQSFDKQGRALIVQLDEIFDDVYRRFGRLKTTDFGKELQDLVLIKGEDGSYTSVTYALGQIQTDIQDELGNYYTKTETASEINTRMTTALGNYYTKSETASQVSTAIGDALGNYYTKTETASQITTNITSALGNYYTKTETASEISTTIGTALGNYYTKTETASQISSSITTALGNYSTTSQTADAISAAVADCYGKISNITINTNGIKIAGNKTVEIVSGSDVKIDYGGSITIKASNNSDDLFHMDAQGIKLYGSRITLNSSAELRIDAGAVMNLKSDGEFRVYSGSIFKVNAGAAIQLMSGSSTVINLDSNGIEISGNRYVKLQSGNSIVDIEPTKITMSTPGTVSILGQGDSVIELVGDQTIFRADSSGIVQAYKVTADQIDVATLNVTNLNVAGNLIAELGIPSFVIDSTRPSGHNIIWLEPNTSVPTPFSETKNVNDTTRNGWSQVGSTYSWTQTVSLASVIAAKGTNKLKISGNLYKNGSTTNQEGTLYATINLANGSTIDMGLVGTFPRLQSLLWNYGFSKEIDITAITAETNISSITFKYATSVNDATAYTTTTNTVKLTASGTRGTAGSSDECTVHYIA